MGNIEYVCVLIHEEECINDNDCENCEYGVDEKFFIED